MSQVVIENPIINSPFREPIKHFRFGDEGISYVKNQNLGFNIPYAYEGTERAYLPDYIVRINEGKPEHLNLILEVTGERRKEKVAKVDAAQTLWIPAINNDGGFGRWAFLEMTDPWNAKIAIREFLKVGCPVS